VFKRIVVKQAISSVGVPHFDHYFIAMKSFFYSKNQDVVLQKPGKLNKRLTSVV
jgi:hypothetical protein